MLAQFLRLYFFDFKTLTPKILKPKNMANYMTQLTTDPKHASVRKTAAYEVVKFVVSVYGEI